MANLAGELVESVGKPKDKIAKENLFAAAQVNPAKLGVFEDIKSSIGFRLLSAIKLYTDCEVGRELGSYQVLLENTQALEFCITLLERRSPEAVPPQAVKTNSLRQIYTLCNNQISHLTKLQESERANINAKLEPLERFVYAYIAQEIQSSIAALTTAGVKLSDAVKDRVDAVIDDATSKGDKSVSRDNAKKSARDVMDLFQQHNQLEDRSMPEKVDSISKKLFACFDKACEKVVALTKQ